MLSILLDGLNHGPDPATVQEMVLPMSASSRVVGQQQIIHYFWDEAGITSLSELHVEGWAVCSIGIAKSLTRIGPAMCWR